MIEKIDIENIASLAKLLISDDEKQEITKDMEEIIKFSENLLNFEINISEDVNIIDFNNVLREDESENIFERSELLKNSKTKTDEYIIVPRVVSH